VWRYDPENADWEEHSQQTGDMPSYGMLGITLDSDGNLYFGSEGSGIVQSDGQQFNEWQVENVPAVAAFGHIVAAPGGALWFIEEYGARVDTVDPPSAEWAPLPDQKCDCVPLSFSADGTMLGAAWDNGLWLVNGAKLTHVSADEGLPADHEVAAAALAEDGTVWIGTDHGLAQFDGQSVTQILTAEDTGFASDEVRALLVASDGSLWAGFDGGLSHLTSDGEWEQFGPGEPVSENFGAVYDLAQDSDGALWVATYGDGAYRFAGGEWENFTSSQPGVDLPSDSLNSVTVAPDGSVWFGTNYSGAARFDGSAWTTFDVPDLINWNVNAIYVEPNGTAWFATSGGVTRYVP
jgi:ligand-binding sensor domain-containing protein